MADENADDPLPSLWTSLGPVEQAKEWENFRPGTFEQLFELARLEADNRREIDEKLRRHEQHLDYIAIALQVSAQVFALAAVLVIAWVAKYYADHHAASEGAKIFGFGAGSIVAAFLGVNAMPVARRITSRWKRSTSQSKDSRSQRI